MPPSIPPTSPPYAPLAYLRITTISFAASALGDQSVDALVEAVKSAIGDPSDGIPTITVSRSQEFALPDGANASAAAAALENSACTGLDDTCSVEIVDARRRLEWQAARSSEAIRRAVSQALEPPRSILVLRYDLVSEGISTNATLSSSAVVREAAEVALALVNVSLSEVTSQRTLRGAATVSNLLKPSLLDPRPP